MAIVDSCMTFSLIPADQSVAINSSITAFVQNIFQNITADLAGLGIGLTFDRNSYTISSGNIQVCWYYSGVTAVLSAWLPVLQDIVLLIVYWFLLAVFFEISKP